MPLGVGEATTRLSANATIQRIFAAAALTTQPPIWLHRSPQLQLAETRRDPLSWMLDTWSSARTWRIVMDAVTPKHLTADEHSHVVKPAEMEWKPTRFPGCEVKTLLMDEKTGLMTALMRFAPGAILPDHEHVNIEQTYVLEGRLVDKEGPAEGIEAKTGEFIWREPGSRHSAWCPEGGLMLAIFQVPNKFYEKDGRVTDPTGKIWDEVWGHTGKG
jgi:anti-sigma factor ChrR (cupin superfamily)